MYYSDYVRDNANQLAWLTGTTRVISAESRFRHIVCKNNLIIGGMQAPSLSTVAKHGHLPQKPPYLGNNYCLAEYSRTEIANLCLYCSNCPHLPSFVPLASAAPAYEHLPARHTPHKLNCSHQPGHQLTCCKQITAAISTLATITLAHAPHVLADSYVLPDHGSDQSPQP